MSLLSLLSSSSLPDHRLVANKSQVSNVLAPTEEKTKSAFSRNVVQVTCEKIKRDLRDPFFFFFWRKSDNFVKEALSPSETVHQFSKQDTRDLSWKLL